MDCLDSKSVTSALFSSLRSLFKTPESHLQPLSQGQCGMQGRLGLHLLSLRAVAVHAAVVGLPAGLPGHPAAHLHGQARLCATLDGAAQLLSSCF